jgi:hypothetical protein
VSDLRENLNEALRAVNPGDPPVEEAIRRGKAIRTRRRIGVTAAVAAVAVLAGAGYPALTHRQAAPRPVTPTHRHVSVTVVPPGPHAHAGTIATGTIDGKAWQVWVDNPKTNGTQGQVCLGASGPAFGVSGLQPVCYQPQSLDAANPVAWEGLAVPGDAQAGMGRVGADVSYVLVRLSDDVTLKLIPVKAYGTRYVAFASPPALPVASATAYLSDGQYLTSVPFNLPDGIPVFGRWQSPGQRVQAQVTKRIAAGSAAGKAWAVEAHIGPWGACFVDTGVDAGQWACMDDSTPMGTQMISLPGDSAGVVVGSAAADVRYLTIALTDGAALRVTPVQVGNQRYFAFYLSKGEAMVRRWTAYNAAGKQLASGKLG